MAFFLFLVAFGLALGNALTISDRSAGTCPSNFAQCGSPALPPDFCCPSTSTCISLDNASSAICCPAGHSCAFIEPITCDVQLQNAAAHPTNTVKTTRLNDQLPACGGLCCPFGYTCQSNSTCALDLATSTTATSAPAHAPSLSVSTASVATGLTASTASTVPVESTISLPMSPVKSAASQTADVSAPTTSSATATVSSVAAAAETGPTSTTASAAAKTSPNVNSTDQTEVSKCAKFPSKAIVAGFLPGALFGAVAALLVSACVRKRQLAKKNAPLSKISAFPPRASDGTVIGISSPFPSDEGSYRTDFLLRRKADGGARSMLQRTGTRVKSLFGAPLKPVEAAALKTPPLFPPPSCPQQPPRRPTTPTWRQRKTPMSSPRQASTESITVYSPQGGLANASSTSTGGAAVAGAGNFLKPEPYPAEVTRRPDTTFTELMERAGFQNSHGVPYYRVAETTPKPGDMVAESHGATPSLL